MVKYITNCFLAIKVSFANEMSALCNKLEINYLEIENGADIVGPLVKLFNTRNKYGSKS